MDDIRYNLSILAYFFSRYNEKAFQYLGYETQKEAFRELSAIIGKENNYLKLRRDEFDALTDGPRKGWRNRAPNKDVIKLFTEFETYDFIQISTMIDGILEKPKDIDDAVYSTQVEKVLAFNEPQKHYETSPIATPEKRHAITGNYKRDAQRAINALYNAEYKCELENNHITFIRRVNGLSYTEPHHLIPMYAQKDFAVSLDVENNIVSLCSNCHNKLHYGEEIKNDLKKLYLSRIERLAVVGLDITFEELLKLYYVENT